MVRLYPILGYLTVIKVNTVSGNRWKPKSFVSTNQAVDSPIIEVASVDNASANDISVKYGSGDELISLGDPSLLVGDDHSSANSHISEDYSSRSDLEETRPFVNQISRGGGGKDSEEGKATTLSSVFNLVNNVAGAGILTLSAGMAPGK